MIKQRLETTRQLLQQCADDAERDCNDIQLLAVSKTKPASDIEQAYAAGQRRFGENYVQEGIEKIEVLQHLPDIEWHFIGPLQSNKTRQVATHFDWVQTVDRLKIAQRLNEQRPHELPPLNVCIQVNISNEASKSGVSENEVLSLAQNISELPRLTLRGLMAIPAASNDEQQQLEAFKKMQALYLQLQSLYSHIDTLSMGMSNDAPQAIKAGSTMVRIGTAIFGARD